MATQIAFVTFGMFIIDEIEYGNKTKSQNLIGGAGVYAALGARLAAGPAHSRSVSWIVDKGSDFPPDFEPLINSWQTSCVFRVDTNRLTTRAWNGYGPNEHRLFKYLTPKIRLEVQSLNDQQALSFSFHMVCSPSRCMQLTQDLGRRRLDLNQASPHPIVIWEPIPDLCTPEEMQNLQKAAQGVTVVSPNADELAALFADRSGQSQDTMVRSFMGWEQGRALSTHAIIREGANGSTVYLGPATLERHSISGDDLAQIHFPAFHTEAEASKVLDPTGGGNTYLGALAIGMTSVLDRSTITTSICERLPGLELRGDSTDAIRHVLIGALYAVVAASYAIEQCGVPSFDTSYSCLNAEADNWNGATVVDRVVEYVEREADYLGQQLSRLV